MMLSVPTRSDHSRLAVPVCMVDQIGRQPPAMKLTVEWNPPAVTIARIKHWRTAMRGFELSGVFESVA